MGVDARPLAIPGLLEIVPRRHRDARGFFAEIWSRAAYREVGVDCDFVQDSHSLTLEAGTVRGLHYQISPQAQAKLVQAVRGSVFDVAVDLRENSLTRGRWAGLTLSAAAGNQLFIPAGFAHGFATLEGNCEVLYKVSAPYSPEHERTIRYDDPRLAIDWPITVRREALSARDRDAPDFA